MIIETEVMQTTIVSNIEVGEVIEMGISAAGMAYAMQALSNMYNDPKLAVIREYFTNALDSHSKAGQTKPVEVSLPTSYNSMYVVQDFGVGMGIDDIKKVYSQYWESTKRDSNTQIGAFGLGAKSALAIANQFTVVSIKDGIKTTVLVQKANDGSGTPRMLVVAAVETSEENGVTVSIPVADVYSFNSKAQEFFRFVDPGMVLVDGFEPKSIFTSLTKLDGFSLDGAEAYVDTDRAYGTSYLVMGQVAYALTNDNIQESLDRLNLPSTYELRNMPVYFKAPIGAVSLTPNREGLLFDDKTNDVIDILVTDYMESVKATAQEAVDAAKTRFESYPLVGSWEDRLGIKLQWRGEDVVEKISTETASSTIKRSSWDKTSHGSSWGINLTGNNKRIIVTGQPFDKYRRMSNYITDYMEMENLRGQIVFYFREALDELDNEWVTEHPHISFEVFEDMILRVKEYRKTTRAAAKALLPKEQRDRPAKMEYAVLDLDEGNIVRTAYDALPADSYYVHASQMSSSGMYRDAFDGKKYGARDLLEALRNLLGDGASVIFIPKTRSLESFLARTKNITGLRPLAEIGPDVQARIDALLTPEVLWHRNRDLNHTANRRVARFPQDKIDLILDEDFKALVSHSSTETVAAHNEVNRLWRQLNHLSLTGVTAKLPSSDVPEEFDNGTTYPLLDALSYGEISEAQQDHLVQYINMVYTSQLTLVDA